MLFARYEITNWAILIEITAIVLLGLLYWYRRPRKIPDGPRGFPLVGYLPFLKKDVAKKLRNLREKYGPVFAVRMGREEVVILNDYCSINEALVKHGTKFSGRPEPTSITKTGRGLALSDFDEHWKSQRKFGLMTLRGFGLGKKSMEERCSEEVNYLTEAINSETKAFDISIVLHNAVSNITCGMVFGKRFEYDDKDFQKMMHRLVYSLDDPKFSTTNRLLVFAPFLKYIPPTSYYYRTFLEMSNKNREWLENQVKEHEETYDKSNLRDFIDTFLSEKYKKDDSSFTNGQLVQYIRELFRAGTGTTSSTLYWSLLCLLHYPEEQQKLREEINDVLGSSGKITMLKKQEMPYTSAFIQEVMRYRTLAPLAVFHKTTAQAEFREFVIPKDTKVVANLWAVHNDPNLWEEPEKFKPERFIDEKGNFIKSSHVIPFSVGPRHCLGEQLARMEVFIFLVGMMQKFEFLPDPDADTLPDIEEKGVGLANVPVSYKLLAKPL